MVMSRPWTGRRGFPRLSEATDGGNGQLRRGRFGDEGDGAGQLSLSFLLFFVALCPPRCGGNASVVVVTWAGQTSHSPDSSGPAKTLKETELMRAKGMGPERRGGPVGAPHTL